MSDDRFSPKPDPLDEAISAFSQMDAPDRPSNEVMLARLTERKSFLPRKSFFERKFLMRSLIPVGIAGLLFWAVIAFVFTNSSTSFVLADVVQAAKKHKIVRYSMKQITEDKIAGRGVADSICYADVRSPRFRTETRHDLKENENVVEVLLVHVTDYPQNRSLMTDSYKKTAVIRTPSAKHGSKPILDNLLELQRNENTVSYEDELQGRKAVKYLLEDETRTTTLWVDSQTKLPVRMEVEYVDPNPNISLNKFIFSDYEWYPEVKLKDGDLFSTKPPQGYTVTDKTDKKN